MNYSDRKPLQVQTLGLIVFITGILYYCFAYLLRVYPSVIEPNLMSKFHITAGGLGLLTAFYYFAYAPMQLPVGLAVDRIGVRRSLLFACLVSITGVFIFSSTTKYPVAIFGRFMIGFGAAFAYVTALKIASLWLPPRYFATAAGFVTGAGMISAILTDTVLTYAVQRYSFETAIYAPLLVGCILFFAILFFIKDKPKAKNQGEDEMSFNHLRQYLVKIIRNPQMWLIGILGAILYLPASMFLDVWGIPYLENVYQISPEGAADGISLMLAGWIISSFASGYLSDLFGTRKKFLILSAVSATILSAVMLYMPGITKTEVYALLFLFGFCCGPHPLCFTLSKENYHPRVAGTAVAFANFLIMMGGFVSQPLVGKVLEMFWDGTVKNGIHVYSVHDYTIALSMLPVGLLIGCFMALGIKETAKQAQFDEIPARGLSGNV